MNLLFAFLLCFSAVTWGGQQGPTKDETPPGVMIRKYKWEKVGPGPSVDSTFKAETDSPNGTTSDPNTPAQASGVKDQNAPFFLYSVELKNDGSKAIKAILWNYLIIDSATNEELGRHEFVSFEKPAWCSLQNDSHARFGLGPRPALGIERKAFGEFQHLVSDPF